MALRDRGTRGGHLDPVILADVDEGVEVPVTPVDPAGLPVAPGPGAVFPVTPTDDFWIRVSKGEIEGYSGVEKFGENPAVQVGVFETVWDGGGIYVPPTAARIHTVVSDSALDAGTLVSSGTATSGSLTTLVDTGATFISDGVAPGDDLLNDTNVQIGQIAAIPSETTLVLFGMREPDFALLSTLPNAAGDTYRVVTNASTGASIFYIRGLGAQLQSQNEFVIINGLVGVDTLKTWFRQFRARVYGPGALTPAVGTVSSTAQVDGTITCQVIDGNNQTLMAVSTVPFPQNGYLLGWWASLSKKQAAVCNLKLLAGDKNRRMYVVQSRSIDNTGTSSFPHKFDIPQPLTGGIDIEIITDTDSVNTGVSGGFSYALVDK